MGGQSTSSKGWSASSSSSTPLNARQVGKYYTYLDNLTGGSDQRVQRRDAQGNPLYKANGQPRWERNADGSVKTEHVGGRLSDYAQQGTSKVDYNPIDGGRYFSTNLSYRPQSADLTYRPVDSGNLGYQSVNADLTYKPVSDTQLRALGGAGATRELQNQRARQQAIDEIAADSGLTLAQRQRSTQLTDRDYAANQDAIGKEVEASLTNAALEQAGREQAGRVSQAEFQSGQNQADLGARQYSADFARQQALSEQSGRQSQAEYNAGQAAQEFAGRQATDAQQQARGAFDAGQAQQQYQANVRNSDLTREDLMALAEIYFGGKGQKSSSESTSVNSSKGSGGSA